VKWVAPPPVVISTGALFQLSPEEAPTPGRTAPCLISHSKTGGGKSFGGVDREEVQGDGLRELAQPLLPSPSLLKSMGEQGRWRQLR
jgi:hypothetical protein